ncbi:MAG TPA: CDP-alcohol phosphatidyltransferase family protein [Gemmatimonadales bacterium]|nr:CDP-alcohol phosphatidyltransferase family protein [Gemmatimonadales bacterium]
MSPVAPRPARRIQRWNTADWLTVLRLPLAVAFPLVDDARWRFVILALAVGSDLLDGQIARRVGSSRYGPFLDPVVDKLFMASAFGVVLFSGELSPVEVLGLLLRDIVAAVAFLITLVRGHPASIPARAGGKAVTVGQSLTLLAFLAGSPLIHPLAWATGGAAVYAIWDYYRAARLEARRL